MSILHVTNLSHMYGDKKLYVKTDFQLFRGDKMGLTGLNGTGKSTLIKILTGIVIPDEGLIKWNPRVKIGYLDQDAKINRKLTVLMYLKSAFSELFEINEKLDSINLEISVCKNEKRLAEILQIAGDFQNRLEAGNFYSIRSEIEKVASGLGITAFGLDTPVKKLSGGQRAKVMLAKLLLENPDVLLLDEPTNFLDKEHIEWLAKFLNGFKGSFILVSHDFSFLNRVVTCICDIENYHISRYNGSYDSFVRQREQKAETYIHNYQHQQKQIAKLEDYISRNLYRASTTAMAQSRRKKLEKMDRLEKPQEAAKPTFSFRYKEIAPKNLLKIRELEVGYSQPILPKISLQLKNGEKWNVSGFNGIGKSTFLKTIIGAIPKLSGSIQYDDDIIFGYYEQENNWEDASKTAFEEIKDAFPTMKDKNIRGYLAKCGLRQDQVMQSLSTLSGGEQAKVKLCKLTLKPCNLLILDEPTNHLDVNAIEQLQKAISEFPGGVLFVSHSRDFCKAITDHCLDMEALFD